MKKKTDVDDEKIKEELSDKIADDTDDVFLKPKELKKKVKGNDKKKRDVVANVSNKYLYKGKINEYDWLQKPKQEKTAKKMSYSEWFNLH